MPGITFDAGALTAAERGDSRFFAAWKTLLADQVIPTVPAPVVAQVWRNGAKQARLALVLRGCHVEELTYARARRVGELCAKAGVADTTDAAVVLTAADRGEELLTSDPDDLTRIAAAYARPPRIRTL